jgi:large subunit ribosomal protein L24e
MVKCVFCGKENDYFKGLHLVGNDGVVRYYCSSKCRKNALKLKRDKRKMKWTEAYHEKVAKTKEREVKRAEDAQEEKKDKKAVVVKKRTKRKA